MHNSRSLPILYQPTTLGMSNNARRRRREQQEQQQQHEQETDDGYSHHLPHQQHMHQQQHLHSSQTDELRHEHGHLHDNDESSRSTSRSTTSSTSDRFVGHDNRDEDENDDDENSEEVDVEEQTHTSSSLTMSHSQPRGFMTMRVVGGEEMEGISSSSEDDAGSYPALYPSATSSLRSTSTATLSSLGTFSKIKHQKPSQRYHRHQHRRHEQQRQLLLPTIATRKREQSVMNMMGVSSSPVTMSDGFHLGRIISPQCLMLGIKILSVFYLFCVLSFFHFHHKPYYLDKSHGGISTIPFPPPQQQKVSVVLMNYSRPRMIQESKLLPTILSHPSIDEVILLHANPKTAFKFMHPKVINIDASRENDRMGLSQRFYFCQLAKNDWVLHVDDDMEFAENTLNEMLVEFAKNTQRIVGRFGRDRKENSSFNGYSSEDTSKETEVILTKFMVMERNTCSAFFEYSHLIWEDIVLNNGEGPLWYGEDIFMSLVANHVYGGDQNNYAMDWLDIRSAPEELKDYSNGSSKDISGGFSRYRFWDFNWYRSILIRNRHYSYRGMLWEKARDRLATSGPFSTSQQR